MLSKRGKKKPQLNIGSSTTSDTKYEKEVIENTSINKTDNIHKDCLDEFLSDKTKLGDLKNEDLRKLEDLGSGSGGIVAKALHIPTGLILARKMIHLEVRPAIRNQILRELKVLHECHSPYIVGFYGAFYSTREINICMEYMDIGSLDKVLLQVEIFPEFIIAKLFKAVLYGLHYLRSHHNVIHRDVKPSNILINSKGEAKICDFGVSGQLIDSMANSFVGTRSYMAPERLEGVKYSIRSDIWSVGLSMVELAIGRYPIPAPSIDEIDIIIENNKSKNESSQKRKARINKSEFFPQDSVPMAIFELLDYIVNQDPPRLSSKHFSNEFCEIVEKCLVKSPLNRTDLSYLIVHPFIVKADETEPSLQDWIKQNFKVY